MMENSFSSPRNDTFNPAGLRVLVVDDDPPWLKILEKMLKKCSYEVTTCGLARDALSLLRERKDGYDIVISDVNMPDMDGFKLLEHVGLEMDLPVIMMSVDGETSRVMKGVQHGACDYLLKPIRMKELRNIWQHVFRKRIHDVREIENIEGFESIQITRSGSDQSDDGHFLIGEDLTSMRKRKEAENKHEDKDCGDSSSTKKPRVVWSVDLHQKFVKAVNQIGFDTAILSSFHRAMTCNVCLAEVGPKKILDLMNVPWLTRENVASHLQKYRLYLSRLQKENELKSSVGGIKQTDSPLKDSANSFGLQNLVVRNVKPKSLEGDLAGIVSTPATESKRTLTVDINNQHNASSSRSSQIGFDCSFARGESEVSFTAFDSTIPSQYPWSDIPQAQLKPELKLLQLEDGFSQITLPGPHYHIQTERLQSGSSISPRPSVADGDNNLKPLDDMYKNNYANLIPIGSAIDSFPVQTKSLNHQSFEPISTTTSSIKGQGLNLSCIADLESAQRNMNWGLGSSLATLDDDCQFYLLQGDCLAMNLGLQDINCSEYNDPGHISEVPLRLYDTVRFDYDHHYDPTEYSIIDQGVFIA